MTESAKISQFVVVAKREMLELAEQYSDDLRRKGYPPDAICEFRKRLIAEVSGETYGALAVDQMPATPMTWLWGNFGAIAQMTIDYSTIAVGRLEAGLLADRRKESVQ